MIVDRSVTTSATMSMTYRIQNLKKIPKLLTLKYLKSNSSKRANCCNLIASNCKTEAEKSETQTS